MFEEYYGFAESPFRLTPNPRFLYPSASHAGALDQVRQAIRRKEGFIVLAGDAGTGKTTLCRTILEQVDATTFTALVLNPFLTLEELLRDVLLDYGIVSRDDMHSHRLAAATKHELVRALHEFLLSLVPINGSAVLIIDEAQHLSAEVLEEIRILSNLETNDRKLQLIVLVGQLNLLELLRRPSLRQLNQRVSVRSVLQPLDRADVDAYIRHRMVVAGGWTTVTFTPDAIDLVFELSGGVPRVINLLCDRALMAGAAARTDRMTVPIVRSAAQNLGLPLPFPTESVSLPEPESASTPPSRFPRVAALVGIVVLSATLAAYWFFIARPLTIVPTQELPATASPPPGTMGVPVPTSLASPENLPALPPPIEDGAFSVVIGTYDTQSEVEQAARTLRSRGTPSYAVSVRIDDAVRRRLLVGRYATREEAQKARDDLAADFPDVRIVYGWFERIP